MGAERKSFCIDDKVKLMTAYHEVSGGLLACRATELTVIVSLHCCNRAVTRWSLCIRMVPCPYTR